MMLQQKYSKRKKSNRQLYVLAVTLPLLAILLPAVYFGLRFANRTQAVWMDDSWQYRVKVPVTAHTGAETNKYFAKTVDTSDTSRFQADCGDIRFTDIGGKILAYYIASGCGTASTVLHVLVPDFAANATDYYMYYGNPSAPDGFSASDFTAGTAVTVGSLGSEEKGQGPVAYWSFDEGTATTAQDSTSNNNDGVLTSGPIWQNENLCVSGKCLYFDGSNDIVSAPDSNSLDVTGTLTVQAWIKGSSWQSSSPNVNGVMDKSGTSANVGYYLRVGDTGTPGVPYFGLGTASGERKVGGPAALSSNQWYFFVGTYDGTLLHLYIDGQEVATNNIGANTPANSSEALKVGFNWNGRYFNGFIDEPKVYNYARSAAQIKADFANRGAAMGVSSQQGAGPQKSLSDGLVGYWKMDESSWTVDCSTKSVLDSSGNANNSSSCPNSTGPTAGSLGKFGFAGVFDGTNDYVAAADSVSLSPSDEVTVSAWIFPTQLASTRGANMTIIDKVHSSSPFHSVWAYVNTNNKVVFEWYNNSGTAFVQISSTTISTSTWYHITGVKRGNNVYVYINGTDDSSSSVATTGTLLDSDDQFRIGATFSSSQQFAGTIDEVRMYSRSLSPVEVRQLYTTAPGPVAYWKLDDNTGSSAIDSSGNTNTGSLGGALSWTHGKLGGGVTYPTAGGTCISAGTGASITNLPALTISAWIKPTSEGSDSGVGRIVGKDPGYSFLVGDTAPVNTTNGLTFTKGFATTELKVQSANNAWTANTWQYVTVTWNGSQTASSAVKMYVNGVETTYQTQQNGVGSASSDVNGLAIGAYSAASCNFADFEGALDDVKIYNYARTSSQIIEDMNGGHPLGSSVGGSQIVYYSLDEQQGQTLNNSGVLGSSQNGTVGATTGAASDDPTWKNSSVCKTNGCLSFDGSNDYSQVTDLASQMDNTSLTMSAWVYPTTIAGNQHLIGLRNDSAADFYMVMLTGTNNMEARFRNSSGTNYDISVTGSLTLNTWQYIALTYDGSTLTYYKNGKVAGSVAASGTIIDTAANFGIGGDGDDGNNPFTGRIDEVKVYRSALTADQITLDMNSGASINYGSTATSESTQITGSAETAPVAYWPFNDNGGTSAADLSGNGQTGTLTNSPTWIFGKYGSAVNLDGNNDYVSVPTTTQFDFTQASPFTVEAWVYPTSAPATMVIVNKHENVTNEFAFNLRADVSGAFALTLTKQNVSGTTVTGATSYAANTWYHVVGVSDGAGGMSLYVNGKLDGTGTVGFSSATQSVADFYIGQSYNNTSNFAGRIDEVKIFNYARTAAQVAYDYSRGAPIGWWQFDECQGSVAHDASPNGNNATLTYGGGTYTQVGTCNSGTSSDAWYGGAVGKFNSSLAMDTTTDTINVGNVSTLALDRTDPFTLSAWIKTTSNTGQTIISKQQSSGNYTGWNMQTGGGGLLYFQLSNVYSSNTLEVHTARNTGYSDGNWHLVTMTYDGSSNVSGAQIYFDGKLEVKDVTTINTLSSSITNSNSVYIGSRNGNDQMFSGQIDDVRVYNYALTAAQVKKLMLGGSSINFGPLTGSP